MSQYLLFTYCKHRHFSNLTIIAIKATGRTRLLKLSSIFFNSLCVYTRAGKKSLTILGTIIRNTTNLRKTLKFLYLQYTVKMFVINIRVWCKLCFELEMMACLFMTAQIDFLSCPFAISLPRFQHAVLKLLFCASPSLHLPVCPCLPPTLSLSLQLCLSHSVPVSPTLPLPLCPCLSTLPLPLCLCLPHSPVTIVMILSDSMPIW